MSGETQSLNNKNHLENHFENKQNSKPKVDINQLLNRVRDEKKKERKVLEKEKNTAHIRTDHKLVYKRNWQKSSDRVNGLTRIMRDLAAIAA